MTRPNDQEKRERQMTDHELLRRAALAAGHEVVRLADDRRALLLFGVIAPWNPLVDDGDALRLAMTVAGIEVTAILENARVAHADEAERAAFVRRAIAISAAEVWFARCKAMIDAGPGTCRCHARTQGA